MVRRISNAESASAARQEFVYRETKQDTGRTTDDGQIIWGQVFRGTITVAASSSIETTLISGLPADARLIDLWGSWCYEGSNAADSMGIGSSWDANYISGIIRRLSGTIAFKSMSLSARIDAPYEAFLDWTDGTLR